MSKLPPSSELRLSYVELDSDSLQLSPAGCGYAGDLMQLGEGRSILGVELSEIKCDPYACFKLAGPCLVAWLVLSTDFEVGGLFLMLGDPSPSGFEIIIFPTLLLPLLPTFGSKVFLRPSVDAVDKDADPSTTFDLPSLSTSLRLCGSDLLTETLNGEILCGAELGTVCARPPLAGCAREELGAVSSLGFESTHSSAPPNPAPVAVTPFFSLSITAVREGLRWRIDDFPTLLELPPPTDGTGEDPPLGTWEAKPDLIGCDVVVKDNGLDSGFAIEPPLALEAGEVLSTRILGLLAMFGVCFTAAEWSDVMGILDRDGEEVCFVDNDAEVEGFTIGFILTSLLPPP